jgi:hypothetical protein
MTVLKSKNVLLLGHRGIREFLHNYSFGTEYVFFLPVVEVLAYNVPQTLHPIKSLEYQPPQEKVPSAKT